MREIGRISEGLKKKRGKWKRTRKVSKDYWLQSGKLSVTLSKHYFSYCY